jgi:TRAP-type C4-dicarboxylate transport system permease small subunit
VTPLLDRLDRQIARVERGLCVLTLAVMTLVLAASVAHRVASRPEGRLSTALLFLLRPWHPDPAFMHGPVSLALNAALATGGLYLALRSRPLPRKPLPCLGIALILTLLGGLLVHALLLAVPYGLPWAPAVGLACMLWAGLLGASLAAAQGRHLSLEVSDHLYPPGHRPRIRRVGLLLASATSALLAALALESVHEHWLAWSANHDAATLQPTDVPLWLALAILPWSFAMMSWRFLRRARTGPA